MYNYISHLVILSDYPLRLPPSSAAEAGEPSEANQEEDYVSTLCCSTHDTIAFLPHNMAGVLV